MNIQINIHFTIIWILNQATNYSFVILIVYIGQVKQNFNLLSGVTFHFKKIHSYYITAVVFIIQLKLLLFYQGVLLFYHFFWWKEYSFDNQKNIQILKSLSTVVRNSKDWPGNLWLPNNTHKNNNNCFNKLIYSNI